MLLSLALHVQHESSLQDASVLTLSLKKKLRDLSGIFCRYSLFFSLTNPFHGEGVADGIYKCLDMPAMEVEKRSAPLDIAVETIAVVAFEAVLTS